MSLLPVGFGGRRRGYEIAKSLRFRAVNSAHLTRTFSQGNRDLWSYSLWVKQGRIGGSSHQLLNVGVDGDNQTTFMIYGTGSGFRYLQRNAAVKQCEKITSASYRDPAAWMHVLLVFDNANVTAEDRVRIYVNGQRVTSFSTNTLLSLGVQSRVNSAAEHRIGENINAAVYADGYMSEINFIDGQALDPSYFGKTDPVTGQWIPTKYTGSYGTNGFYLDFKDGTNLTTLGYDKSGNGNDWTLNNISLTAGVTYDWMDDSPTNNFAVLNTIAPEAGTIANANLSWQANAAKTSFGTIPVDGKRYWEFTVAGSNWTAGLGNTANTRMTNGAPTTTCLVGGTGTVYSDNVTVVSDTFTGAVSGDVMAFAFDADAKTCDVYQNGGKVIEFSGVSISGPYFPGFDRWTSTAGTSQVHHVNFGQRPFAYTPPTGFKSLCTANLTSDDVIESGTFTGNANADGPFVWCNGTPETLTINGNAVTWGTYADRLANGFKLRTASTSYNAVGSNNWTSTILSPERKSAFRNQRAKGNP